MKKKLIASAVVSAVALSAVLPATAANPNAPVGLDNVLGGPYCEPTGDGVDAGWYDVDGSDYFAGETKYGGDLEVDAELYYGCYVEEGSEANSEGSETATVDVDLSQDESDPFVYTCFAEGEWAICSADIDWEDLAIIVDDAAADRFAEEAESCAEAGGQFYTYGATLEGLATFGVKEMNPGKKNGRQNYEKAFASCELEPALVD